MELKNTFTERVTLGQDGAYRWKCQADRSYEKRDYKRAILILLIIAALCLSGSAIINPQFMLAVIPVIVGFLVVAALLFFLMNRISGKTWQQYVMNGQSVQIINASVSVFRKFRDITEVVCFPEYLELHEKGGTSKICVPPEDYAFVKDYILFHTLGKASVRYENKTPSQ